MKEQSPSPAPSAAPSQCYVNRELSWLQFNRRVLEEAEDPANPLCERLNFASIFQSNLDEFYMVRMGMLMDTLHLESRDDKTGLTSAQQASAVLDKTREYLADRDRVCKELLRELASQGVELCRFHSLQDKAQSFLEKYFTSNVLPLLSPQIIGRKQPFPFLRNKQIYAVAILKTKGGGERMGIVPCGEGVLRRLVPLPGEGGRFVLVEELIAGFLPKIFTHYKVEGTVLIRLVRSADIHMDDASSEMGGMLAEEYRKSMEKMVRRRKRLQPVRLDYQDKLTDSVRDSLCSCLGLSKKHLFSSGAPLDLTFMGALRDMLRDKTELFYPRRVPQNSPNVDPLVPMAEQIRRRDLMLSYPYENVRPLLRLLQEAGQDPDVVSIKMTLYRVAHNSKIVEALVDAAEEDINSSPIVMLVKEMIDKAVRQRASDIHIEPTERKVRVRYRIDGALYEKAKYDINVLNAMVARIKIIGGMDIAEKRKPQDGRITQVVDRMEYDIRVSVLPTVYGEKVVMRLTSKTGLTKEKSQLGLKPREMEQFDYILQNPHGILLVTGPTGSGKSTTLYTALSELNKEDVNIITVEDPVEANIDGINQVQVNPKAELTFATALRSILRQDPDIIMIGEIRDRETASIAVQASITGHLVVSTLHTNSSASTITRLEDMGIESYLIADSVIGVIAQRLVRRLCKECKRPRLATADEKELMGCSMEEDVTIYEPCGCSKCENTGYKGRIGVYEIMKMSPRLKTIISKRQGADAIKEQALQEGMYTLRMSATEYVLDGTTSFEEMVKVSFDS